MTVRNQVIVPKKKIGGQAIYGYRELKARQREVRGAFSESLALRTHRALSWLQRAERDPDDADARFIFLWVAFNAAYANEIRDRQSFSERWQWVNFLGWLLACDREGLLDAIVWQQFTGPIRLLIDNQYVFQPFWDFHNGWIEEAEWRRRFETSKAAAKRGLAQQDTRRLLAVVLDRLYTLRNQIIHGGATWNSGVNRAQVNDGAAILALLVPTVVHLMMESPDQVWGDACYPVVESQLIKR